jgi:saccharopine dehydrogenase-like NADP-dependent oxidoreductase
MQGGFSPGIVVAVSLSAVHQFSKPAQKSIRLLVGLGVEGDAHQGVPVVNQIRTY